MISYINLCYISGYNNEGIIQIVYFCQSYLPIPLSHALIISLLLFLLNRPILRSCSSPGQVPKRFTNTPRLLNRAEYLQDRLLCCFSPSARRRMSNFKLLKLDFNGLFIINAAPCIHMCSHALEARSRYRVSPNFVLIVQLYHTQT